LTIWGWDDGNKETNTEKNKHGKFKCEKYAICMYEVSLLFACSLFIHKKSSKRMLIKKFFVLWNRSALDVTLILAWAENKIQKQLELVWHDAWNVPYCHNHLFLCLLLFLCVMSFDIGWVALFCMLIFFHLSQFLMWVLDRNVEFNRFYGISVGLAAWGVW